MNTTLNPLLRVFVILIFSFMTYSQLNSSAESGESCACPKVDCGPCEVQSGLTFYSKGCGNNQRKSCARPSCQPKDPLPESCIENSAKTNDEAQAISQNQNSQVEKNNNSEDAIIGKVTWFKGIAWISSKDGLRKEVQVGINVNVSDKVISEKQSEVKIVFQDNNELLIQPDTVVTISDYKLAPEKMDRRVLLDLIKGKVRNRVKNSYGGTTSSHFRVRTKSAVAGVRGTDFVVTFGDSDREITKVSTLTGLVELSNSDFSKKVEIPKSHEASYIFDGKQGDDFVASGFLSPVVELTNTELNRLDVDTDPEKVERKVASQKSSNENSDYVCRSPLAQLNQCLWKCENNPSGSKDCRTDLPQVQCVRKRCNANGEWADETRLPASFKEQCGATGIKVRACDY